MTGLLHHRTWREHYFHAHPLHGVSTLVTSIVLSVLLILVIFLMLVPAAK